MTEWIEFCKDALGFGGIVIPLLVVILYKNERFLSVVTVAIVTSVLVRILGILINPFAMALVTVSFKKDPANAIETIVMFSAATIFVASIFASLFFAIKHFGFGLKKNLQKSTFKNTPLPTTPKFTTANIIPKAETPTKRFGLFLTVISVAVFILSWFVWVCFHSSWPLFDTEAYYGFFATVSWPFILVGAFFWGGIPQRIFVWIRTGK